METKQDNVLLYVPNLIGYFRLLLLAVAFYDYHQPVWFFPIYTFSVMLDAVDGYVARKLNQCSDFGAWLDIVVDMISRGLLWCSLSQWGYLLMTVEWLTFLSTHCRGANWKIPEDSFPWVVTRVMEKGFKTWWGAAAIGGLHLLPVWIYAWGGGVLDMLHLPLFLQLTGLLGLMAGRLLCLYVEVFYIYNHVTMLLHNSHKAEHS